jgi:hypothetical protein
MSERGVFAVDRGIWDHPMFECRERFSKREAWLWLLSTATWKAKAIFVDGKRVALARGQLAHSIRFLADQWRWPRSNVVRFLNALKTETMIGTQTGSGITIITICKYDEYQRVSLPERDASGTASGTKMGHERDKEEDRESKEYSEPIGSADEVVGEDPRAKLFRVGKTLLVSFGVAERRTGALIGHWLKTKNDPAGLLAAIQYARDHNVAEPVAYISTLITAEERPHGRAKSGQELCFELADEWRQREREAGLQRSADHARSH